MQETSLLQWLVLALIQGITEYLPISSSAHLILVAQIMHWPDQGLIMDLAAHAGSLIAVMWYFRAELIKLVQGRNWTLFSQLSLATIPLAIVGLLFASFIENHLRTPMVIGMASLIFGVLLYVADKHQQKTTKPLKFNLKAAIFIGLAQVLALIPGTSRSGVTMTAALAMGYNRTQAARFSFLLAIPALMMTSAYGLLKVYQQPSEYQIIGVSVVFITSFFTSLLSIYVFLKLINKIPMAVFMWYRVILALVIIGLLR